MLMADVRQKFLDFFRERGHAIVPPASLIPENDPTTLFTGSGMQPMVPYLLGEKHPSGTQIADIQKCFRSQDIEEVGDNRHTTLFEMLGSWSFGTYFKEKQIPWMFEFLTSALEADSTRLYITVFRGNESLGISRDTESVKLWQEVFRQRGIEARDVDFSERDGMQGGRIFYYDETKNWWSRSGVPSNMPVGEPGGPDSEMFWDFGSDRQLHETSAWKDEPCHVNCDCGRFMEIGNNVFMEYQKTVDGFIKLKQRNVDFGGGLERFAAALNNDPDLFKIDAFTSIIKKIEELSNKKYSSVIASGTKQSPEIASSQTPRNDTAVRSFRIIADHIRAATFIIGDERGVVPSNIGQGYIVRRLIRRAVREGRRLGIKEPLTDQIARVVIGEFGGAYPELKRNADRIASEMQKEEEKFGKTIEKGMKELEKMTYVPPDKGDKGGLSGEQAFILFSTYGFPLELTEEILKERGASINREKFEEEFKKHQELSRTSSAGKFKGGLADHSVETTRLHTATHLLHRALKNVLGEHVEQRGSNITPERLRFDFSHPTKMTVEQIKQAEQIVNDVIAQDLPVRFEEMTVEEAKKRGAIGLFEEKYGEKIKVYFVGDDTKDFSKEICGGPHVTHTGELGSFKIQKEEAVSAGVRRIKANLS
ncbi:MAG: alanine--tRNA ligase [Candidatus Uhrbacteria bacterium]|nr:alanine--tRNA ligase [Candidatus Uhrbacteria bacterium]